jgi:Fe(3+) dicitrate transport protein
MTVTGRYPRDIRFRSHNAAAFIENVFRAGKKWLFIPGIRYEWLEGTANGISSINATGEEQRIQDISRSRQFILAGFSAEYHITDDMEWYSSIAQAYRPIQFANLQAAPTTDIVDPALKDARGYNYDMGIRGKMGRFLQFDLSGFYMNYDNRVGVLSLNSGQRIITNVGASTSKGFEGFLNLSLLRALKEISKNEILLFGSYSYTDARYSSRHKDESIRGKKVENAPAHIFRGGITAEVSNFSLTAQYSFTDASFSDANNTVKPTANAQAGLIPAYRIVDLTAGYRFSEQLSLKAGINNLFNEIYFTRRAGGYPGPGAMPADGRTGFLTVAASF